MRNIIIVKQIAELKQQSKNTFRLMFEESIAIDLSKVSDTLRNRTIAKCRTDATRLQVIIDSNSYGDFYDLLNDIKAVTGEYNDNVQVTTSFIGTVGSITISYHTTAIVRVDFEIRNHQLVYQMLNNL